MLRRQSGIYFWEKRLIPPGAKRNQEISHYVNQAHLILFLLSPDFLASDECYGEMKLATKRMDAKEASVIPLLIRRTAGWEDTPIGKLEPLPADRKPIRDRTDREKAMRDIAEQIQRIIEKIRQALSEVL